MKSQSVQYNRILVATDESECAKKALAHAHTIATINNSSVALVHVMEVTAQTNYVSDPLLGQQPIVVPDATEAQMEHAKDLLNEIAEQFSDLKEVYTFHRVGIPRQEILDVAAEWDADLIIMGTHGRTGFDHFLSGSVSESVVRRSLCPVLVVPCKKDSYQVFPENCSPAHTDRR